MIAAARGHANRHKRFLLTTAPIRAINRGKRHLFPLRRRFPMPPSSTVSKDHTLRPAETTTPAAACRDGGANNDYAAALAMLDLFASVGATRIDVT